MKKHLLSLLALAAVVLMSNTEAKAQELEVGADLVSSYVWRGAYQTGVSIQPSVSLGLGNFSVGAWGSSNLLGNAKELDFTVGYTIGGLTIAATDYWWEGEGAAYFDGNSHYLEGTLSYSFGENFPLTVSASTFFSGYLNEIDDKCAYSTYIDLSYGFSVEDVDCSVGVGITPSKGYYSDELNVCSVSLSAAKSIALSSTFELPLFTQLIFAPATDNAFLVVGVSF